MVEIRSQENDTVKLPNNIRQVGMPGDKSKIYIEDYVMTYLNQAASQKPMGQHAAILLGEALRKDNADVFFISAAIHLEHLEIREDYLQLTTDMWSGLYETMEKYFKDKQILGWFLSRPGQSVGINGRIEKVQSEQFKDKGGLLYVMDPMDREDNFYMYEHGQLIRQQGYYIYYERNEAMQNYMIEMRKDGNAEENGESAGFQNRLFERKKDNQIKKEAYGSSRRKGGKWLPQAAAVVLVVLIAAGIRKNIMNSDVPVSQAVSRAAAEETTAGETSYSGSLDIVESVMQQAAESANETEAEDIQGTEAEISGSDSQTGGDSIEESQEDGGTEMTADTEVAAGTHQSYTVKEGDTLLKISRAYYQDAAHVEEIIRMNQIEDPDYIYPGMVLQLP